MPSQLADKIALVTAGGSGIGRATCRLLAAEGATVAVVDIDGDAASETEREIASAGGAASAHEVDCSDVAALESLFADVDRRHGRLDVLYNHAGIPNAHGVAEIGELEFDRAVDVNLRSGFFATKLAVPLMTRHGGGSIVFTASTSGLMGSATSPLYSMTKHGVVGMVRSMAQLLAPEGIRVNAVCPGPVRTPMLAGFMNKGAEETDAVAEQYGSWNAMNRVAEPEEIAAAVLFLASDAASFVNGVPLPVDAGFVAK